MNLFSLFATLALDTGEFTKGVNSATNQGKSLASSLGGSFKASTVAMGNLLSNFIQKAGQMTMDLGKSAVEAAATVRAEKAKFQAAFGDMADEASAAFGRIGDDTNILDTRLQNVGTKAFSQFKGAGVEDSLGAMERYTRLAADAAAYYDISLEDADTRLRSFLRGNTEAGDAIGLFTSETQRNTYATEQYGKKWAQLTEAQKQMLMLNVAEDIYNQSGAIGQAAREGDSWANTVSNLQEAWRQTLAVFGDPLVDSLTPALGQITEKLQDPVVQQKIATFASAIGGVASATFDNIFGLFDWLSTEGTSGNEVVQNLASFFGDIGSAVTFIFTELTSNEVNGVKVLGALAGAAIALHSPLSLIVTTVALIASNWDSVRASANAAFAAMSQQVQHEQTAAASVGTAVTEATGSTTLGTISQGIVQSSYNNPDSFIDWSGIKSWFGGLSSKAVGMDYVPYDDYPARLHEGEAVLTKLEATEWRRGSAPSMVDTSAIAAAVSSAMQGFAVYMDGQKVGNLVTETVSRNIAREAHSGRYAT